MSLCLYVPTGQNAPADKTHYRCANRGCGHERVSEYDKPEMLHRTCKGVNPQQRGGVTVRIKRWQQAVAKWKAAGKPVRTDVEVLYILETKCQPCEHFNPRGKCRLCDCKLNIGKNARFNKIRMATEACPDHPPRWPAKTKEEHLD